MKSILITFLIIILSLVLIKYNTNNLQFMTGDINIEENFNNPDKNFVCEKDEVACVLSYQKYNQQCQDGFGVWKKFQDLNHNQRKNGKKIKILALDSTQYPNLRIGGDVDGPKVSVVTRYNIKDYNGILNLENLQKFLNESI